MRLRVFYVLVIVPHKVREETSSDFISKRQRLVLDILYNCFINKLVRTECDQSVRVKALTSSTCGE